MNPFGSDIMDEISPGIGKIDEAISIVFMVSSISDVEDLIDVISNL